MNSSPSTSWPAASAPRCCGSRRYGRISIRRACRCSGWATFSIHARRRHHAVAGAVPAIRGNIRFDHVTFRYRVNGREVLHDITSASINDISQQAAHAAGIASRAVSQARETDGTVQGLAKSAGRIGEVVGLINTIAAQTNLLALNATIEAARAGEAGRGFAVVASEVKSLASQTAKATEEISEQISEIQKVAGEAIDAIKGIGGIIGEVNEVATAIAAAVQQQGAATQEITRSTQYAAQGTKNVSDNIMGVKTDADAAATAADDVKNASETLETQSRQLGNQVTQFLGKIRAA